MTKERADQARKDRKIIGDIWDHEAEALRIWLKHFEECAEELGINYDGDEHDWAEQAFIECQQLKILQDGSIKVKWEHPCWWADCEHPVFHGNYYCVLAHPKDVSWKSPYDLAIELKEAGE
jgi:hypothetical protein